MTTMKHPKWKGDRSTLAIMLGLQAAGYEVSVPFGENTRSDLIADDGERLLRVQCKTGRLRNGVVVFATCSCYGHHPNPKITSRDYHGDIDAFGVYCMKLGGVYFVPISELPNRRYAALRIAPPLNNQYQNVRFACDYEIAQVDLLLQNLARPLVLDDLPLHPLQRIVDRLRIAAALLGHLLVGASLEVEAQCVGLQLRQARAEAEDEALQLLGRDDDDGRLLHGRAGQRVAERALAVGVLTGRGVTERHVAVQRLVLEAGRGLDRRNDLARDAKLGEGAERRLLVRAEIAHRLIEADQPFLDQVLRVAAGEEVRARLQPDEPRVAPDQLIERDLVAVSGLEDELQVLELSLSLLLGLLRELSCGCRLRSHVFFPRFVGEGRKSHPQVEEEDSSGTTNLQPLCRGPCLIGTYVRI